MPHALKRCACLYLYAALMGSQGIRGRIEAVVILNLTTLAVNN